MKRAALRRAVDVLLADNGFARGWYGWNHATLIIYNRNYGQDASFHLPAGKTSKKKLIAALSTLSPAGSPLPYLPIDVTGAKGYRQIDIEDCIRDAR